MKMKEGFENLGKARVTTPDYIKATRSLRPKEFIRPEEKFSTLAPHEKCIEDIFRKGLDGNFRDVDMAVHLRRFQE